MRAMVLHRQLPIESSPLALEELPDPLPGPREVRLKVLCCAVCRTDLHIVEGDLPLIRSPLILGHQIVGLVDAVGPGCTRRRPGQRLGIAWLRQTCGLCEFCAAGRENLCPDSLYTGYHAPGGFAEYAVAPEDFTYELPQGLGDLQAAPLLCAGIIGYRALKRANLPPAGKLAIFGFGSSAHVVIQLAVHQKHEVYVVSRTPGHQYLARSLGAGWVGETPQSIPQKVHSAIVFSPAGYAVPAALECLRPGGTVALAGIHMTTIPPLDYARHLYGERNIHPVTANTREDAYELLSQAAIIPVRASVVSYPLHEANRALQDLKSGRIDGTGVLVI